jgi:hypothetical protein
MKHSIWKWFAYVRFGSKADMCSAPTHVRFTPECVAKLFLHPKQAILIQG